MYSFPKVPISFSEIYPEIMVLCIVAKQVFEMDF